MPVIIPLGNSYAVEVAPSVTCTLCTFKKAESIAKLIAGEARVSPYQFRERVK